MQNHRRNDFVYAGFFIRLSAYLIDMLVVSCLLFFLRMPVWFARLSNSDFILTRPLVFRFSIWDFILYLIGVAYFIVVTYKTGTTIGKKLMGIKVVAMEGELTLIDVCYRETIGRYLSQALIYLGYILVGVDSEKRGIHDMLCDTRVVYAHTVSRLTPMPTQTSFYSTSTPSTTSNQERKDSIPSDKPMDSPDVPSPSSEEDGI